MSTNHKSTREDRVKALELAVASQQSGEPVTMTVTRAAGFLEFIEDRMSSDVKLGAEAATRIMADRLSTAWPACDQLVLADAQYQSVEQVLERHKLSMHLSGS